MKAAFERQRAHAPAMARTTAAQRRERLAKLAAAIEARRDALNDAVHADFGRPAFETELAETQHVLAEISHAKEHLGEWMKDERVPSSLLLVGTSGRIRYEPKGVVLVMAPWNYPFALLLSPLVAAIAAGNCAVLKPSEKTPHVAALISAMIRETFDAAEVACVEGGADVAAALLELPFDHICFTGSTQIGKVVMAAAAKHLASVTLELGGKSPAIVGRTTDIRTAADRIVWGKFFNAGQTCIAPDYVLVHASREKAFLGCAREAIERFFGAGEDQRARSTDLARIVDDGHFRRLKGIIEGSVAAGAKVETGARFDAATRYIAPTMLSGVTPAMPVMGEEIFGPILPVLTFEAIDDCVRLIRAGGKPLAMYIFASRDTLLHYASHTLPFGGVGASGIGSYHGVHGFRAFSHARAVMRQREPAAVRFFFPPYRGKVHDLARRLLRIVGCLAVILLAACGRAQWQEADTRMNDAAQGARAQGFTPMSGPHNTFGAFTDAGVSPWRIHLEAHQPYFIAAACTTGCDSLHFTVSEPHGTEVGADTTAGPTPRLVITAPEEGDYTVTFTYAKCTAPKCRWVAQVYSRKVNQ